MVRVVLSVEEAEELYTELRRAIDEAKDHQTTFAAFLPLSDISVDVNPHLTKTKVLRDMGADCTQSKA